LPQLRWGLPGILNDDGLGVAQFDPAVTVGPDGTAHAVWLDFRDGAGVFALYYAARPPGASRWTRNLRVSDMIGTVCRDDPDVAVGADGTVYAVWSDYRERDPDVYMSSLEPGAAAWSLPHKVNEDTVPSTDWRPTVVADPSGGVVVAWSDFGEGDSDIYTRRRDVDGVWQPELRVNGVVDGAQDNPALLATPGGDLFAAWSDGRNGNPDIYVSRLPAGTDRWGVNFPLNGDLGSARQAFPALGAASDGTVMCVWIDERRGSGVWSAWLQPGANGLYDDQWSQDAPVAVRVAGKADRAAVVGAADGSAVAAWYETGEGPSAERVRTARWVAGRWGSVAPADPASLSVAERNPALAAGPSGDVHLLWYGEDSDGQKDVYASALQLPGVGGSPYEAEGRLEVSAAPPECGSEGYVVVACDGASSPWIVPIDDANGLVGEAVRVVGTRVEAECPRVVDARIVPIDDPCPPTGAVVTGQVSLSSLASPAGAVIGIGPAGGGTIVSTTVGPSGRFLAETTPGRTNVTATADCHLAAATQVSTEAGSTTRLAETRLAGGDVNGDCRIDLQDLVLASAALGEPPPFAPACVDGNGDRLVDLFDLSSIGANYGETCPSPWDGGVAGASTTESVAAPAVIALFGARPEGAGDELSLPLVLITDVDVYGIDITLGFDPSVLEPLDADPDRSGVQPFGLGAPLSRAFVARNAVEEGGRVRLAATLLAPDAPLTGTLRLADIGFKTLRDGNPSLRILGLALAGAHGEPVEARVEVEGIAVAPAYRIWLPEGHA
jgi:hypothetical protein